MSGEIWAREECARLEDITCVGYWENLEPYFQSKTHGYLQIGFLSGETLCGKEFRRYSDRKSGLYWFHDLSIDIEYLQQIDCKHCLKVLNASSDNKKSKRALHERFLNREGAASCD